MLSLKLNPEKTSSGSISKSRSQLFFPPVEHDAIALVSKNKQEQSNASAKKLAADIFDIRNCPNGKSSSFKNTLSAVAVPPAAKQTKTTSEVKSHWGQFVVLDPIDYFKQTNFNLAYYPKGKSFNILGTIIEKRLSTSDETLKGSTYEDSDSGSEEEDIFCFEP